MLTDFRQRYFLSDTLTRNVDVLLGIVTFLFIRQFATKADTRWTVELDVVF